MYLLFSNNLGINQTNYLYNLSNSNMLIDKKPF